MIKKKEKHVNHLSCEQDNMNANNVHGQPEVNAIYQELVEFHERLHYEAICWLFCLFDFIQFKVLSSYEL